ncbi:MAG TPA: hypothetical protein VGL60_03580, partial [Acidimicrobiales bacterium]
MVGALLLAAVLVPVVINSTSAGPNTTDLKVLLIGASPTLTIPDPTTPAWAAELANEGVAYTEVDAAGTTLGSETVTLPTLTSSSTHGLFDAVVVADGPADFATGQLTALDQYESAFGVREIDTDAFPSPALGLNSVTESNNGDLSNTTATLTATGLAIFSSLKGPVPLDTGTFASPATVAGPLPAGASETPLLDDASGNVLMGIYQHPSAAQSPTDPQAGVAEMTLDFNYNATDIQWLILGPALIDWVTGGVHLGLYRNYIGQDVDDVFISDNQWSTEYQCTPAATDPSDYTCPAGVA